APRRLRVARRPENGNRSPGGRRFSPPPPPPHRPLHTGDTRRRKSSGAPRAPPTCDGPRVPTLPPAGSLPPSRPPSAARIVLRAGARHAFFEQPILQHGLGEGLLEARILLPQPLHLRRRRLPRRVPQQPLLARLEALL